MFLILTVAAKLDIEVNVNCPHCDGMIDILDEKDTGYHDHNEEGSVIKQACPEGIWVDEHKKFKVNSVTCSNCRSKFNVEGLEW